MYAYSVLNNFHYIIRQKWQFEFPYLQQQQQQKQLPGVPYLNCKINNFVVPLYIHTSPTEGIFFKTPPPLLWKIPIQPHTFI